MWLWEMLLTDVKNAEYEANRHGYLPPADIKRVKYIKIHPHVFHDLAKEEAALLKENKLIRPYIKYDEANGHKFDRIPLWVDPKTEKWEVVI